MGSPIVSIIVPVYNAEVTLARCVQSILSQSYTDIEVILVDDGSTDTSPALCDIYAQSDSRVRVIHQENQGECGARNSALAVLTGTYVQCVDADDWIELEMTKNLVNAMDGFDVDLVVCSFMRVYGNGKTSAVNLGISEVQPPLRQLVEFANGQPDALLRFGASWNKLFRRSIIEKNHIRFANLPIYVDAYFNFEYIRHIRATYFLNEPLYHYVVPQQNLTVTTRYRAQAFELNEGLYETVESFIGKDLTKQQRSVLNRHYLDKILIVLKMLCRKNDVYTETQLKEKVREIVLWPKVRQALQDFWPEGTQDKAAIQLLNGGRWEELYHWAWDAPDIYGGSAS